MTSIAFDERTLTELDHARLARLLQRDPRDPLATVSESLKDALDCADLVPSREVAPDVVTMYSRVTVEDTRDGRQQVFTLCYPEHAEPASGFVSVLSPIGTALLGRRVGELAVPGSPDAGGAALLIREILFQPEASGDYTM